MQPRPTVARLSRVIVFISVIRVLSGCNDARHPATAPDTTHDTTLPPDVASDADTPTADTATVDARTEPYHVVAVGNVSLDLRTTSPVCVACHTADTAATAMRDSAGRDVSPYALWQGTMKANAARDPFFRATLSAERARFPGHAAAIDAKCLGCHAPLAALDARMAGTTVAFEDLGNSDTRGHLGADGVTCTACHGISATDAGAPSTWSGNPVYNTSNLVFGPHASPFEEPMRGQTSVVPAFGSHMLDSTQCASCHTLVTHALDLPDAPDFNEQTPWLEWLNSDYSIGPGGMTCQDCHMPKSDMDGIDIVTRIARRPGGGDFPRITPRSPFGRHMFVGGNTLIPEVFKRFRETLLPSASDAAFDAVIAAAKDQLETDTVDLTISEAGLLDGRVVAAIRIVNRTGHKFPSGYPSRRAWLHVRMRDDAGSIVFESGAWDSRGRITDASGAPLPTELAGAGFNPHRTVITQPADVVIWETVMGDRDGAPTIALLRAVEYLKDNRFLPAGWRADGPHAERTRPVGVEGDTDFAAGSDIVRLAVPDVGTARSLEVRIVYQVLGARWAAELFSADTPDVRVFEAMIDAVGIAPVIVAHATIAL